MVKVHVTYQGNLRCRAVHGPSGAVIETDAPTDNHGKGEAFSPTDLVGTAMATCMLTIMGIVAQRHEIDITGTTVDVTKEMKTGPQRRIARLTTHFHLPARLTDEHRTMLRNAALTCPVHRSMHPEVELVTEFYWDR